LLTELVALSNYHDWLQVVADDYDAIIAISKDVYGGHDYLPYRYKMWCEDSHRELFGVSWHNVGYGQG
jgi:hypothetical protein